jgi:electron transport complex protein RnfC
VLGGISLIMKACGVDKSTFAIEENKADAIAVLREKNPEDSGIEILQLPCRYPQGAEKQLIQTVTGREVPPGGLPAHVGCAVFNTFTAYSVYRALHEGRPAIERIVTVTGSAIAEPKTVVPWLPRGSRHRAGRRLCKPQEGAHGGPIWHRPLRSSVSVTKAPTP